MQAQQQERNSKAKDAIINYKKTPLLETHNVAYIRQQANNPSFSDSDLLQLIETINAYMRSIYILRESAGLSEACSKEIPELEARIKELESKKQKAVTKDF